MRRCTIVSSVLSGILGDVLTRAYLFRKRLLSLAAQKFVSDIAADAYQHARIRTNAAGGGRGRGAGTSTTRVCPPVKHLVGKLTLSPIQDKTKTVLTMDDLSAALSEYGINSKKPEFFM